MSRKAVSGYLTVGMLIVGMIIGIAAFYVVIGSPTRTATQTVTSTESVSSVVTTRVTTSSILPTTITSTNTVTSTLTSTAYATSTANGTSAGEQELLNAQQNVRLLLFKLDLAGPSYNFTVSVVNGNSFSVTITSLRMCTIRLDGDANVCQSSPVGQSISARSNFTLVFSNQSRPDPGPLGASASVTLQTPYGMISQGPVDIYPVSTYYPEPIKFEFLASNFMASKSNVALALASPSCTLNVPSLATPYLEFTNNGATPTAIASISIAYGGGSEKVSILNPTVTCAVASGQTMYVVFTGVGATPASAEEQFVGTASLANGESLQFTGAFYP